MVTCQTHILNLVGSIPTLNKVLNKNDLNLTYFYNND